MVECKAATRIVLVGCGRWGRHILRDLNDLGCLVTVVARSFASRDTATAGAASQIVSRIADLSAGPVFDGIVVATPTNTHWSVVNDLLDLFPNLPIFCEKCLAPNLEQARDLETRAPNSLFVMDKWRYHPGISALKKIVQSQELGNVIGIRTIRAGWGCSHDDVDSVWILLSHEISILLEILGKIPNPETARVDAQGSWAHGMIATLGKAPWTVVEVSSRYPTNIRETRVFFEHGVAMLSDAYAQTIKIVRSTQGYFADLPVVEERSISQELPLRAELSAFVEFLRGNAPPPKSSAQEGRKIVETIINLRILAGLQESAA